MASGPDSPDNNRPPRTNHHVCRQSHRDQCRIRRESFEDAISRGIKTAGKSLHGVKSAWVKSQQVVVKDNTIASYRVDLKITFVLD